MKYLLLLPFSLFLTGCFGPDNCPTLSYSGFKYGSRVTIHGGFYDGQKGSVRAATIIVTSLDSCNEQGFRVKLDNGSEEVTVKKTELEKTNQ